jgi:hypothetical protein
MTKFYCLRFEALPTRRARPTLSPRNRVAWLCPQVLASLFVASYDSQDYCGGIRPRLHTEFLDTLLQTVPFLTSRHGPTENTVPLLVHACPFTEPFPSNGRLFSLIKICYIAVNVILSFFSQSLPRNWPIRHNTYVPIIYKTICIINPLTVAF